MTKYITLFDTTTEYNNASLDLPNVSYTLDDLKVHYNPYDGRLVAKYNVTSTSSTTKLLGSSSNISAIEIDGTALDSVVDKYKFSTTGKHTIKYALIDNTSIGTNMFYGCSRLMSIIIPDSVTSIDESAFYNCSGLTSVIISDSVTSIGSNAFYSCSGLTSMTIPNSVTSIQGTAFESCSNLTSIIVNGGNPNYDSRNNCNAIIETATNTLITGCMNTTIPNSVTSIGESAFYGCSTLTSVTIPNSVTSIDKWAFYSCSGLTSVTIGNSVTSIGDGAFRSCSTLTTLTVQVTTPPTLGSGALSGTNTNLVIKVPSASVNTYKSASGWSSYASKIQSI